MGLRDNLSEWSKTPFESQAHLIEAMRSPEYRDSRNSAFREAVEAKIGISSNTGTAITVYSGLDATNSDGGLGESDTEAAARRHGEEQEAERALLEQYGSLALSPAKQARLQPVERQLPGRDDGYGFQPRDE
jgi:hypothetical protein